MKVKYYFYNGNPRAKETEVIDFPDVADIEDSRVIDLGEEMFDEYMEAWANQCIEYPDRAEFDTREEYEDACDAAEYDYYDGGWWDCEEVEEE